MMRTNKGSSSARWKARAAWIGRATVALVCSLAGASGSLGYQNTTGDTAAGATADPAASVVAAYEAAIEKGPRAPGYRAALVAARDSLVKAEPAPLNDRERDLIGQRSANNELIKQTLVGRYVIVLCTDGFARRAKENHFVATMDLAYLVLKSLCGNDPIARSGNRFIIWTDPSKPGGHSCQGLALQIAIGRGDADNADWFEQFFHEMTHGFQYDHPANVYFGGGLFEGFAEFNQAMVCDYLAPLGSPFAGRLDHYSKHFPAAAKVEYLDTRLPIEEMVAYDPSAGLLMELVNTTKDGSGAGAGGGSGGGSAVGVARPDWKPLRELVAGAMVERPWVPPDLWPMLFARQAMRAFGEVKARPILEKYRFPMDEMSASCVETILRKEQWQPFVERRILREWRVCGPIANDRRMSAPPEWDPLDAQNMAWDEGWLEAAPRTRGLGWRTDVPVDERGVVRLTDDQGAGPQYWYVTGTLPEDVRGLVTLCISSDDDCSVWLDGELVYVFRDGRAINPDMPDIVYAEVKGPGRIVALVLNRGMPAAFSMAVMPSGLVHEGQAKRLGSTDASERAAAVRYLATRRLSPWVTGVLLKSLDDPSAPVRAAAAWGLGARRNDAAVVGAMVERLGVEGDGSVRSVLRDALAELTFQSFMTPVQAARWWEKNKAAFGEWWFVEAEDAYFLGRIWGGFYGNNAGACNGQCVARDWGADRGHWLITTLESSTAGPREVRVRYSAAEGGSVKVRIRRGEGTVFESVVELKKTKDWATWSWATVDVPSMDRGRYYVELVEPSGSPDIDVVGWTAR